MRNALAEDGIVLQAAPMNCFLTQLKRGIWIRQTGARRWSKDRLGRVDILYHVHEAEEAGARDEALWLTFLAAHFGRDTASEKDGDPTSASRFFFAFGPEPVWTWSRVSGNPDTLRHWLFESENDLRTLAYGNHRKFESKQPADIWTVIESFIGLVAAFGGTPSLLFETDPGISPQERFDQLFQRLRPLYRFGRTGRFDFLGLLADLRLIDMEAGSCYLRGSTGPLSGARKLWHVESPKQLEWLAQHFAARLGIAPAALEDALCTWQKHVP